MTATGIGRSGRCGGGGKVYVIGRSWHRHTHKARVHKGLRCSGQRNITYIIGRSAAGVITLMGGCQAHHITLTPAYTTPYHPILYSHITSATHPAYPRATIEVYALCMLLGWPMVQCYDSVEHLQHELVHIVTVGGEMR